MRKIVLAAVLGVALGGCASTYVDAEQTELERRLAGTPVKVVRRGDDVILTLPNDVTFAVDRAEIAPAFFPVLNTISEQLAKTPNTRVSITGHADSTGTDTHNQLLSERRAAVVGAYFAYRGLRYDRLTMEGEGERSPVASNDAAEGRALNRRVEVLVQPVRPAPAD